MSWQGAVALVVGVVGASLLVWALVHGGSRD